MTITKKAILPVVMGAALMLASCGGGKYKVAVTFPDDSFNGKVAFLTS